MVAGGPGPVLGIYPGTGGLLAKDPRVLGWFRPAAAGFNDQALNSWWGALTSVGTAVPLGGGLDGNAAFQVRASAGTTGFLRSARLTTLPQPIHVFAILQSVGSPTANATWWSGNGGPRIAWQNSTHAEMLCSTAISMTCNPANYNLIECFFQGSQCRFSINGGAYSAALPAGTGATFMAGLTLGDYIGVNKSDFDLVELLMYEGQMGDTARSMYWANLRATFPSLGLPASPPVAFLNGISDPSHLITAGCKIIGIRGQSNATRQAVGATVAATAGILELGNDNVVKAFNSANWDSLTAQVDMVSADNALRVGTPIGALANTYQAGFGGQIILCGGALGGSSAVPPNPNVVYATWDPAYPRSNAQRNNCLYSYIYRLQQLLGLGCVYGWEYLAQGEFEGVLATSQQNPYYTQWVADTIAESLIVQQQVGIPERMVYTQVSPTVPASNGQWGNFRTLVQPALASASRLMISAGAAVEADLLHWINTNCDTTGAAAGTAALGAGW